MHNCTPLYPPTTAKAPKARGPTSYNPTQVGKTIEQQCPPPLRSNPSVHQVATDRTRTDPMGHNKTRPRKAKSWNPTLGNQVVPLMIPPPNIGDLSTGYSRHAPAERQRTLCLIRENPQGLRRSLKTWLKALKASGKASSKTINNEKESKFVELEYLVVLFFTRREIRHQPWG